MGTKIKNLDAAEAQRRLAAQLEPRSQGTSGTVPLENFESTSAELDRLTSLYQSGHNAPQSKA